jgi:hypothetical protein
MTTMYNAPSPRGTNNAGLYLTRAGHLVDKHGNHWGRSSMKMALDAALASPMSTGPKKPQNPIAAQARGSLHSELKKLCDAMGLEHGELRDQITDLIDEAERKSLQEYVASLGGPEGKGKGALDDDDDEDDEIDEIDERVRKLLRGKGLADDDVEKAIELARKDRAEAKDRLPANAIHGGMGGHLSGVSKHGDDLDLTSEYGPGIQNTTRDVYGAARSDENPYDPVRRLGERAAERLPGGGVSRRLTGDVVLATDEDIEQQIEREYGRGPGIGMFGR